MKNPFVKGVVVAVEGGGGVECDEDDWESFWTEVRFDLVHEDEGEDLSNDDCDKHSDDNCDDGASF